MEGVWFVMASESRVSGCLRVLVVAVVLAFGAAGCGSDDNGDGNGEGGASAADNGQGGASTAGDLKSGTPAQQVMAAYAQYIDARFDKRWEQACATLSAAMRKRYPKEAGFPAAPCVESMRKEAKNLPASTTRPRATKAKLINSRVATAYVKPTPDSTTPLLLRFVKQDGAWKLNGAAKQQPGQPQQKPARP